MYVLYATAIQVIYEVVIEGLFTGRKLSIVFKRLIDLEEEFSLFLLILHRMWDDPANNANNFVANEVYFNRYNAAIFSM